MNQLDDWENSLDEALHAFANPLPPSGFETRLPALAALPERRGFGWWLPLAVSFAACVAIATFYVAATSKRVDSPKAAARAAASVIAPAPRKGSSAVPESSALNTVPQRLRVQRASLHSPHSVLARPAEFAPTFPAASPPTPEEERMQQLAQNPHVRFLPPQTEIQVSALEITPLSDPQPIDRSQP